MRKKDTIIESLSNIQRLRALKKSSSYEDGEKDKNSIEALKEKEEALVL